MQGDVEAALGRLLGAEPQTFVAGRTDAGVHAVGQVMSVPDVPDDVDVVKLRDTLNVMLQPSISIWGLSVAADDFHARFSARSRTYVYAILQAEAPDPFLAATTLYHREPLDVAAMNEAAGHLIGPRDFSSFGRVTDPDGTANRVLFELRCTRDGDLIRVRARANSFVQQMVRSVVGTLLYVGEGRMRSEEIPGVLEAKDRSAAGPVAPPHGLCLVSVEYDSAWKAPFSDLDTPPGL